MYTARKFTVSMATGRTTLILHVCCLLLLMSGPLIAQEPKKAIVAPEHDGMLIPLDLDSFEQLVVDDVLPIMRDYQFATRNSLLNGAGFVSSESTGGGYMTIRRTVPGIPGAIDECKVAEMDDRQYVNVKRRYPDGSVLGFTYMDGKCDGFTVRTSKEDGPVNINANFSATASRSISLLAPSAPGEEPNAVCYDKHWDIDYRQSTLLGQTSIPLQAVRFYLKWREKWVKRPAELPKLPPEANPGKPKTSYDWKEPWTKPAPPAGTGK